MPRLVHCVVVAPLLVVACGSDGEPAVAPDVTFNAPPTADGSPPENAALPLTSLQRLSYSDDELILRAAHRVTADCMAEQGFDYPPFESPEPSFVDVDHPFGPWTEEDIPDAYGQLTYEPRLSAFEQFTAALPPDRLQAWEEAFGKSLEGPRPTVSLPDGTEVDGSFTESFLAGCGGGGYNAVFGDYAYREALRQEIERLGNSVDVDDVDAVEQALNAWHDCMEAEGIDVDRGPDGPIQLAADFGTEPGVTAEERQTAELDVRCKDDANLHDAYFSARADAEEQLIEDNQLFVEAWRELVRESLVRAREILARP